MVENWTSGPVVTCFDLSPHVFFWGANKGPSFETGLFAAVQNGDALFGVTCWNMYIVFELLP